MAWHIFAVHFLETSKAKPALCMQEAPFFWLTLPFLWKANTFDLTLYRMRCTINFRNETFNNEWIWVIGCLDTLDAVLSSQMMYISSSFDVNHNSTIATQASLGWYVAAVLQRTLVHWLFPTFLYQASQTLQNDNCCGKSLLTALSILIYFCHVTKLSALNCVPKPNCLSIYGHNQQIH